MAVWECAECTTKYAVGASCCPHCRSTVRVDERALPPEEDGDMAKITVHGGPSNAAAEVEAGEDVSAGSSSSTSSETPPSTPEPSETPRPKRARGAGSRSKQGLKETGSSTVGSTDSSGPETADD